MSIYPQCDFLLVNTKVKVRHRYIKTHLPFTDDIDNNSKLCMKETNYRRQSGAIKFYWQSSVYFVSTTAATCFVGNHEAIHTEIKRAH
jgi:hypothetical protein